MIQRKSDINGIFALVIQIKNTIMQVQWKGVMPAVTTKFNEDDTLDLRMFRTNIEAQIHAGVSGIILGGTLGEASTLNDDEKQILIQETVEIVDGKIPVIINIAEQSTKGAILAAKRAKEYGASGLMMLPPMRYNATDYETVAYFKAVAQSTELPIMMFEALLVHDNIEAVKESTRDISNITRIRNRFGNRLNVLCGVDTLALESILMGADGWVAGLVCAFPEETVAIHELAKAGRVKEAIAIYRWFLPLLELDISPQLVQNIKLAEVGTGIGTENVRAPRLPLQGVERNRVLNIIEEGIRTRPILPDYKSVSHSL